MRHRRYDCSPGCSVEACLEVIGGKWKGVILHHLLEGPQRFSELQRRIRSVTQRMLTTQLRELEADGVVHRRVYAEVPPRVEYSLAELGRTLVPIILLMRNWGDEYLRRKGAATAAESVSQADLAADALAAEQREAEAVEEAEEVEAATVAEAVDE